MKTIIVIICLLIAAMGCGQSPDDISSAPLDPGAPSAVLADADGIRTNVATSNANWFPYGKPGKLKRWANLIPLNTMNSQIAEIAADLIEDKLDMVLFDRGDYSNGIIINEGGGDEWCGNVSNSPGEKSLTVAVNDTGEASGTMYINVGSISCQPTVEIYVHEFGHAMFLGGHFAGFYDDIETRTPKVDANFWNALYTLYHNPVGSDIESIIPFIIETEL